VADNGSTDGSVELAASLGARVIRVPRRGYGNALLTGIEGARGRYVIMADADDSYDWSGLDGFVAALRAGADLVMGCRFPAGGGHIAAGAMPWLHRHVGNPVLSFLGRMFFGSRVMDFHCGMRGFLKKKIIALDLLATGMEFATEMVVKATLAGHDVRQVPVTLRPDGRGRRPHLRTWRDGWRHLRFLLLWCPNWLFMAPGIGLMVSGLGLFALVFPGGFRVGGVTFDLNTLLLGAFLSLIGFHCLSFAISAKVYGHVRGFLPGDALTRFVARRFSLEAGLGFGLANVAAGIGLFLYSFYRWSTFGFGAFPTEVGVRLVVAALTWLFFGVQVVFSSFFLSLLLMRSRERCGGEP
jgi:glycosyltransferase involved in cell wall biosynthesis